MQLSGEWKPLGREPFPLSQEIQCDVFSWTAPKALGRFRIPFYCPVDEYPRRYFCGPVLNYWQQTNQLSRFPFLGRVCRYGVQILTQLEEAVCFLRRRPAGTQDGEAISIPPDGLRLFESLFRNRFDGRAAGSRQIRHVLDLFDNREKQLAEGLLIPGVPVPRSLANEVVSGDRVRAADAHRFLQKIFPVESGRLTVKDIIGGVGAQLAASKSVSAAGDSWLFEQLPQRTELDYYLVDGALRETPVALKSIWTAVSSFLIPEFNFAEDSDFAQEHSEEYRDFGLRLCDACLKKTPHDFDSWLRTEREHSYVRLLPDSARLRGRAREAAGKRATRYFRLLLWASCQAMSRCYGALMLIVWNDFTDANPQPSHVESMLFRQLNSPQLYLAGLPLAFFAKSHLQWFLPSLLRIWGQENLAPEVYDHLHALLGIGAITTSKRRLVDRERKAEQRRLDRAKREKRIASRGGQVNAGNVHAVPQSGQGLAGEENSDDPVSRKGSASRVVYDRDRTALMDSLEDLPIYSSNRCDKCQGEVKRIGECSCVGDWVIVEVDCAHCDTQKTVRFNLREARGADTGQGS